MPGLLAYDTGMCRQRFRHAVDHFCEAILRSRGKTSRNSISIRPIRVRHTLVVTPQPFVGQVSWIA